MRAAAAYPRVVSCNRFSHRQVIHILQQCGHKSHKDSVRLLRAAKQTFSINLNCPIREPVHPVRQVHLWLGPGNASLPTRRAYWIAQEHTFDPPMFDPTSLLLSLNRFRLLSALLGDPVWKRMPTIALAALLRGPRSTRSGLTSASVYLVIPIRSRLAVQTEPFRFTRRTLST